MKIKFLQLIVALTLIFALLPSSPYDRGVEFLDGAAPAQYVSHQVDLCNMSYGLSCETSSENFLVFEKKKVITLLKPLSINQIISKQGHLLNV